MSYSCSVAQSSCASLLDFTSGSVTRALFEANATVSLWFQYLALQVLSVTRLSTSSGDDVDTWIEQFGMSRLTATAASADETFICLSPSASSALVPVGAVVKSSDGSVLFSVVKDTTNEFWSTSSNGYIRQKNVASIVCPIVCNSVGISGNVAAGTLNVLGTQISGIDTCTNISSINNGFDQESDDSVRGRVNLWFQSLSSATLVSIESAISSVSTNLYYQITENEDPNGNYRPGFFYVSVDDGSGDISQDFLNSIKNSIEKIRACGVEFSIIRAGVIYVDVIIPVVVSSGANIDVIKSEISSAVNSYVNQINVGLPCSYTKLNSVVVNSAENDVVSVGVITINGASEDIAGSTGYVVRVKSVEVNFSYS